MMTVEATLSLIVSCLLAGLLAHSMLQPASHSLYGTMLANDFAESIVKSPHCLALVSDYFGDDLVAANAARMQLGQCVSQSSPSSSICLSISSPKGNPAPPINDCAPDFSSSFAVERDVLINGTPQRILFSAYFL